MKIWKLVFKKYKYNKIFYLFILLFFCAFKINKNKRIINTHFIPKISIFLPIYNKAKFLKRSVGSLRFQTLKDIEIIPVNDCSEDNTLQVLNKIAMKDPRIKIVNNDKNRGLLYSRAMGILNSKGEYLMNLDPDDELQGRDNLEFLYQIANETKVDIISFGLIKKINGRISNKFFLCSDFNNIQFQPQIFNFRNKFDYLITNKLVKKELFMKAYSLFKDKIYGEKWNYGEDEIWSSLVNKYATSKICVAKVIYIYHYNNNSLMNNRYNYHYLANLINWIEMFIKILNKNEQNILINRLKSLIKIINNKNFLNIIKKNNKLKNKYIRILKNITIPHIFNNSNFYHIIVTLES